MSRYPRLDNDFIHLHKINPIYDKHETSIREFVLEFSNGLIQRVNAYHLVEVKNFILNKYPHRKYHNNSVFDNVNYHECIAVFDYSVSERPIYQIWV